MHFEPKTFTLKDGRTLVLKNQEPENALEMLEYMRQTSAETENMVRYPEEVEISEEEIQRKKEMLKENQKDKRSLMLGAFLDGKLVGNAGIQSAGERFKMKHRASFGIAIIKEAWGLGIGGMLLDILLEEAPGMGYEMVELGVCEGNERGISLYNKKGFIQCGRIPKAFKLKDGTYRDEILMYRMVKKTME
ncbi:GNAT family N-acetyltransferase [Murimonas intestini]|uniref:GNAT family N-acetyltransferase n=1 Tax=Murimonas intestini TaxID=1337051 RepID=UPI0011DE166F|nr:GNAT family N-acetyltransferase [Murimonas intestini]